MVASAEARIRGCTTAEPSRSPGLQKVENSEGQGIMSWSFEFGKHELSENFAKPASRQSCHLQLHVGIDLLAVTSFQAA